MATKYKSIDEILREEHKPQYIQLSIERVRAINRWRVRYIALYFGYFIVQSFRLLYAAALTPGQNLFAWATAAVLVAAFYYWFIPALRGMGYPWAIVLVTSLLALVPIPGILIVAYLDRTIGKMLRQGMERAQEAAHAREESDTEAASPEHGTQNTEAAEQSTPAGQDRLTQPQPHE